MELKNYWVFHEKNGYHHVLAKDPRDAIEQYYDGLKSIIGHHLKICPCFGDKRLDRSKVLRPKQVKDDEARLWNYDFETDSLTQIASEDF